MLETFCLVEIDTKKCIAEGCILPDGQAAIAWKNREIYGCYPNFELFKSIQMRLGFRDVIFEISDSLKTFHLLRNEDATGISGTGIVAKGCYFENIKIAVLQWMTEYASTFWYPSIQSIEDWHGHEGRTEIIMD